MKLQREVLARLVIIIRGRNALSIFLKWNGIRDKAIRTIQVRLLAMKLGADARKRVGELLTAKASEQALRAKWLAMEAERKRTEYLRNKSLRLIQRVFRGFRARKRVARLRRSNALAEDSRKRLPAYYSIREDYYKSQNFYHKKFIVRIQCAIRSRKARDIVYYKRRDRSAVIMWRAWSMFKAKKKALVIVKRRREDIILRNHGAIEMQRIIRGFMGRYEARKHRHSEAIKWLLREFKARGHIGKVLVNHRLRKAALLLRDQKVAKIQAMVRGVLGRVWFHSNCKRLKRERHNRVKAKRTRAAIRIQSIVRMLQARVIVEKRAAQFAREMEIRQQMEELENRLGDMHTGWMGEILATRIETQARSKLAKNAVARRSILSKTEKEEKERQRQASAATRIQALARGVAARIKFALDLPILRKQLQMRLFCVECEVTMAVRKCRQCKDRFCATCYESMHKKGTRKTHNWEPIRAQQQQQSLSASSRFSKSNTKTDVGSGTGGAGGATTKQGSLNPTGNLLGASKAAKKLEWEEFYDANAKAKYWFNKISNEATWKKPY